MFPFPLIATTVVTVWILQPVWATQHFLHMSQLQIVFLTLWYVLSAHWDEALADKVVVEGQEVGTDTALGTMPGIKV